MSHVPHELVEEFPADTDRIRELRASDAHFKKITDEYHDLNRAVHRAETRVEPTDSFNEDKLRKQRMQLKDEIAAFLAQ